MRLIQGAHSAVFFFTSACMPPDDRRVDLFRIPEKPPRKAACASASREPVPRRSSLQTLCPPRSHSFVGSMPSKKPSAKPCPLNSRFSFLQAGLSVPTKAARANCLPGMRSASATYEINSSVILVSSRTNAMYPDEDERRKITASARSFWTASSVYRSIPSRCSNQISPPAKGRRNDFFLAPGSSSGRFSARPRLFFISSHISVHNFCVGLLRNHR